MRCVYSLAWPWGGAKLGTEVSQPAVGVDVPETVKCQHIWSLGMWGKAEAKERSDLRNSEGSRKEGRGRKEEVEETNEHKG